MDAAKLIESEGERLEVVALRWGLETWARAGAGVGGLGAIGVSVIGVSTLMELEESMRVWNSVLDGLPGREGSIDQKDRAWSIQRSKHVRDMAGNIWKVLGGWKDYAWASPGKDYVNTRVLKRAVEADSLKASRL